MRKSIFSTACSPRPNSIPATHFTTKLGRQGCRRKAKTGSTNDCLDYNDIIYNNTIGNSLYNIQKVSICILITKGMLPLVSIQHNTPRHRAYGYFRRGCKTGFVGSHVGAFRIRHNPPFAIKDHRIPPCLQHAYYKTLLLPTAADRLAEYNPVRFGPEHNQTAQIKNVFAMQYIYIFSNRSITSIHMYTYILILGDYILQI